jgi:hypothetical protein
LRAHLPTLVSCLLAASVSAAGSARLVYAAPDGCPSQEQWRQLVAARIGKDPFVVDGRTLVRVTINRPETGWTAEVVVESPGSPTRRRTLTADECFDLAEATAVTVALSVEAIIKKPDPQPVVETVAPVPVPTPAPTPPEPPALTWSLGAGLGVMAGVAPSAIPVVRAEGRARATWWSLGLEGRFHWPLTTALPGGFELAAGSLTGALVPCGHYRWFRACVDVAIGGLHLEGANVLQARGGWVFHASGGLRIGLMIPFNDTISAGLMAEGQVAFMRTSAVLVTEQGFNRVWTYPLVGGGGTAVLSIRL